MDRDISIDGILGFAVGLALLIAGAAVVCWALLSGTRERLSREDPPPSPMPEARARELPPEPRLQSNPPADMVLYREREEAILHSYGWADEEAGTARIPIDRAIEMMVDRGVRPALEEDPRGGSALAGGAP